MDDAKDLLDQLCTLAGTIMEDASIDAVTIPPSQDDYLAKIERIELAGLHILRLARAAKIVLQRQQSH